MKQQLLSLIFVFTFLTATAQVGIGTTSPDASSVLDIVSSNKGFIAPRINLNNVTNSSIDGANTNAAGLMIYNTNASVTGGSGVGYYYWDGSVWVAMKAAATGGSGDGWQLDGNSIASGDFLGTINNQALNFRVNNINVGSIKTDNSLYLGRSAASNGARSVAIGYEASSSADESAAFGRAAIASGARSTAIGYQAAASKDESTALGRDARASGAGSTAAGFESRAQGDESAAYGRGANASSARSTAIGFETTATADDATALGRNADASAARTTATGFNALASNTDAAAYGRQAKATGSSSTAVGANTTASQSNSSALGNEANASAINTTALGYNSDATADQATGIGNGAQATGVSSVVVGDQSVANDLKTIAIGYSAEAVATNAIAIGDDSYANKAFSMALGSVSDAKGDYSIALGYDSYTSALNAVAIGRLSDAQGQNSIALGFDTYTNKTGAVAIGINSESTGTNAIAIGTSSRAPQDNSIILGDHTNANVRVGIGTNTPQAKLQVNTSFRYVDGNQAAGRVLTSDGDGDASWETPTIDGNIYANDGTLTGQRTINLNQNVLRFDNGVGRYMSVLGGDVSDDDDPFKFATNNAFRFDVDSNTALEIESNRDIVMPIYGGGTRTGTPTYNLAVDANGRIIETVLGSGISSGMQYYSYDITNSASPDLNNLERNTLVTKAGVYNGALSLPTSGTSVLNPTNDSDGFVIKIVGTYLVKNTGNFTFSQRSDDGARIYIDGSLVLNDWVDSGSVTTNSRPISLAQGKHKFEFWYYENSGGQEFSFSWGANPDGNSGVIQASQFTIE